MRTLATVRTRATAKTQAAVQGRVGTGGGLGSGGDQRALPEVTVPLVTLQGRAVRAGENRLLGPLDPALARDLAAAAARSPSSRWEVTVVDEHGYAAGHGIARPRRGRRQKPQPPGESHYAFPARINITVTDTRLRQLAAQAAQPRSGAPPGDWELVPRAAGTWALILPGGRELAVRFDVVPTHECDHRHEVSSYEPSERLRRLVQVRDRECTFPPCSRPAKDSDWEHAVPYDQGGRTDACNAGARSRRCHQVKQSNGLDGHPAQARLARMDDPDGPDLRPRTMALHRMTTPGPAYGPSEEDLGKRRNQPAAAGRSRLPGDTRAPTAGRAWDDTERAYLAHARGPGRACRC